MYLKNILGPQKELILSPVTWHWRCPVWHEFSSAVPWLQSMPLDICKDLTLHRALLKPVSCHTGTQCRTDAFCFIPTHSSSESVPVFLKISLTLLICPLFRQRCSVVHFPGTKQCRKQWPGTRPRARDFPRYCSIRKGNGCYVTPICHVGKLRHRAVMQLPHSCTANQRQIQENTASPILGYKTMVEKGNQPDRPKVATGILATSRNRLSCLQLS